MMSTKAAVFSLPPDAQARMEMLASQNETGAGEDGSEAAGSASDSA